MKSFPILFCTLLLMVATQVFADDYYQQPYNPWTSGGMVPNTPIDNLGLPPLGYTPTPQIDYTTPEQRRIQQLNDLQNQIRIMNYYEEGRASAASACRMITGNPAARRQCFSEIK